MSPVYAGQNSRFSPVSANSYKPITRKKKRDDGILDVIPNLLMDVKDAGVGVALAIPRGIGYTAHDIGRLATGNLDDFEWDDVVKDTFTGIIDDYKYTYGSGDWGETYSRIKQHPLGPVLDILTIASLGAGASAKGASVLATSGKYGAATEAGRLSAAKHAGLERVASVSREGFDVNDLTPVTPRVGSDVGRFEYDPAVVRDGEFDPHAYAQKYLPDKDTSDQARTTNPGDLLSPDLTANPRVFDDIADGSPTELDILDDLIERFKTPSGYGHRQGKVFERDGKVEFYRPREKMVSPKALPGMSLSGKNLEDTGYVRQVGQSAYTRGVQNVVDAYASRFYNSPGLGASGRGGRQATRIIGKHNQANMQANANRLGGEADYFKKAHPVLYSMYHTFFPSSASRVEARNAQVESLGLSDEFFKLEPKAQAAELAYRRKLAEGSDAPEAPEMIDMIDELLKTQGGKDRKSIGDDQLIKLMHLKREQALVSSPAYRAVDAALRGKDGLDDLEASLREMDPDAAAELSKSLDDDVIERYREFIRDGTRAYYNDISSAFSDAERTYVPALSKGKRAKQRKGHDSSTEKRQQKRGSGEEAQFRRLAGEGPKRETPAGMDDFDAQIEASVIDRALRYGIDVDGIRNESNAQNLGLPILSHSVPKVAGGGKGSTGVRGHTGSNSPEFKRNLYISNKFALNQFSNMHSVVRTVEHAAIAAQATNRFRGLLSQIVVSKEKPGRGFIRLNENQTRLLHNGLEDIISFVEDDFSLLSGGSSSGMIESFASQLNHVLIRTKNRDNIWIPEGAAKSLFPEIKKSSGWISNVYRNTTRLWRNITLGTRPQWMFNNLIGNLTLLAIEHSIWNTMRSLYTAYTDKDVKKIINEKAAGITESSLYHEALGHSQARDARKQIEKFEDMDVVDFIKFMREQDGDASTGETHAGMEIAKTAAGKTWDVASGKFGLRLNARMVDDPARIAAFLANLEPHIKRYREKTGGSKAEAIAKLMQDPEIRDWSIQKTLRDMIDYRDMSAFERQWVRGAFPFYAWLKGMSRRFVQLGADDPYKLYALNLISEEALRNPDYGDGFPEWMRRLMKVDNETMKKLMGWGSDHDPGDGSLAVDFGPANIFQTPSDIAHMMAVLSSGEFSEAKASGSIASSANPIIKAIVEAVTGKNLYTGSDLSELAVDPQIKNTELIARRFGASTPMLRDLIEALFDEQDPQYTPIQEDAGRINHLIGARYVNEQSARNYELRKQQQRQLQILKKQQREARIAAAE